MRSMHILALVLTLATCGARAAQPPAPLAAGATVALPAGRFTLTALDTLPHVQDEYTKRFTFDRADNPKLKDLRERYKLDDVVAPGKDEFDRQLLLLDWANRQLKKFGRPTSKARGALEILEANDAGHTFFCAHYADLFVSAAASFGWVDRPLALRRPNHIGSGSTEHSSTEIWSNQYRKWVMLDPTFAMYVEKGGVPLNAYELRQAWLVDKGEGLTFVLGKDRKRYTKADIPVFRQRYAGFGDLVLDGGALNVYAFIGYVPNTNLLDAGPDYGRMFITQDALCDGTTWHKRTIPKNPAVDPYFPINQANLTLTARGGALTVSLKTFTPNFKTFQARLDGGEWKDVGDAFAWTPHAAANRLEVRVLNAWDVAGPIATARLEPAKD